MVVIVCEYPKSGATWLVSLLGNVLDLPKRDIYIDNASKNIWGNYFWYKGYDNIGLLDNCIAKSHEPLESSLHPKSSKYIHLIRDGRDVIVSKYYYESEFLVRNGIKEFENTTKTEYVLKIANEWKNYVSTWQDYKQVILCKYEDLLINAEETLLNICSSLNYNVDVNVVKDAIANNSKEKLSKNIGVVFKHNTFIRKGIAGDWKNFFGSEEKKIFKEVAGQLLIDLGYEKSYGW